MKTLRIFAIIFFAAIPAFAGMTTDEEIPESRKIEISIAADREKIIQEDNAIKADIQDIEKRKAVIKELKKRISDSKDRKNDVVYGKQLIPKRSYEAK